MWEFSPTDGKFYDVQYFERAVFEYHIDEASASSEVLLSLLGRFRYLETHKNNASGQKPNTSSGSVTFKETGKRLGGKFLTYWRTHGGLAQQGYPISDEFTEVSPTNGKTYAVQYFERAVFEYHPENAPPNDVLLSQLGRFRHNQVHPPGSAIVGAHSRVLSPGYSVPAPTPPPYPPTADQLPSEIPRGAGIIGTWDCTAIYIGDKKYGCDAVLYISARTYELWKPSTRTKLGTGTVQFTGHRAKFSPGVSGYPDAELTDSEELTFFDTRIGSALIFVRRF